MFNWNQKSINWYHAAARQSHHHQIVSSTIAKYLKPTDVVYDLGCGLGYLSLALAPKVKKVVAVDINPTVLEHLNREIQNRQFTNIETVQADWNHWQPEKKADVSLLSYCNGVQHRFTKLKNLTRRKLLTVLLMHNTGRNFNVGKHVNLAKLFDKRETIHSIQEHLTTNKIPFHLDEIQTEFGQPFKTLAEVKEFIQHYFNFTDPQQVKDYIQNNIVSKTPGYYLPNPKFSGLLGIDLTKDSK